MLKKYLVWLWLSVLLVSCAETPPSRAPALTLVIEVPSSEAEKVVDLFVEWVKTFQYYDEHRLGPTASPAFEKGNPDSILAAFSRSGRPEAIAGTSEEGDYVIITYYCRTDMSGDEAELIVRHLVANFESFVSDHSSYNVMYATPLRERELLPGPLVSLDEMTVLCDGPTVGRHMMSENIH